MYEIQGLFFFLTCGCPIALVPFTEKKKKDDISSIEFLLNLCQNSVGHMCMGLLLGSLIPFHRSMCPSLHQSVELLNSSLCQFKVLLYQLQAMHLKIVITQEFMNLGNVPLGKFNLYKSHLNDQYRPLWENPELWFSKQGWVVLYLARCSAALLHAGIQ